MAEGERSFTVLLRAMQHLTAEVTVDAFSKEEAGAAALRFVHDKPEIWVADDPEDRRVESVSDNIDEGVCHA